MSAYAEYLHGMIDYDELKAATAWECREERDREREMDFEPEEQEEEEDDDRRGY